ncbi:receptor-like cytosolic serine/threonine-protein kinase RBK1 isoform X1 [Zingiber officinale]|uniref:receptor-like cytosolic serine/threonine-protein kinase RBK1 isoform X1 n=1 Tax=Zingiber officinale TaxID=94328 RepID=UPI001C4DB836|nr:receptor-like cytosolic serine/threonine-protein kinase RBK1 isoform X1 [Zingiber officinale]XP_042412050.1 receptor-like cytosolic serine/threonine-protein kinase RBK1 isoform X1 [Zingiber officinale]
MEDLQLVQSQSGGSVKEEERERKKGSAYSLLRKMELESRYASSSSFASSSKVVILACDATREHNEVEMRLTVNAIRMRGDILCGRNTLIVLGVLHMVTNPMGYQTKACTDSFGGTSSRALEEEVWRKLDKYESMLQESVEKCKNEAVSINIKITAGTPAKIVVLQEVLNNKPAWLILDRHLRRDMKFYMKHITCKVASVSDNLFVAVPKPFVTNASSKETVEQKLFSVSRSVQPSSNMEEDDKNIGEANVRSLVSFSDYYSSITSQDYSNTFKLSMLSSSKSRFEDSSIMAFDGVATSGVCFKEQRNLSGKQVLEGNNDLVLQYDSSEKPILCAACGLRSILYIKESMKFQFSEIQDATNDFSKDNLLGEGGFGFVYKGQLKDDQFIAAKVRKDQSTQGYNEFFSEVHVLSFARHRNIVMLLGYCCKEKHNILVYEYICNKSLHWHLFNESAELLEWDRRHAIALGIAKGLRFLHEECRGGPIIHRDLRPSNVLLTHDFVPMLGDFGLAKWKSNNDSFQTQVLGTSGYLAPEYAEFGIVSVRTDVYSFGVLLFQLISGRPVIDEDSGHSQHILQWAEPLVENLALHDLIDPVLGESYDTYELYRVARAAFLCVRRNPEMRPSVGEVVHLLEEGHVRDLAQQFVPYYTK